MNKIYFMPVLVFSVASLSAVVASSNFENFLQEWETIVDHRHHNVQAKLFGSVNAQAFDDKPELTEENIFTDYPEGRKLYQSIAQFNKGRNAGQFDSEIIKENIENVCSTLSKNAEAKNVCRSQFVQNRDRLCKAAPVVAQDTCTDILKNAFPSDVSVSEKPSRFRDKLKFWKRFQNPNTKASA